MAKKDTKKKIVIGTAVAGTGAAAAMAHPKVRKEVGKLGKESMDKAKDLKEDIEDKL